jgi:hypothetical protein
MLSGYFILSAPLLSHPSSYHLPKNLRENIFSGSVLGAIFTYGMAIDSACIYETHASNIVGMMSPKKRFKLHMADALMCDRVVPSRAASTRMTPAACRSCLRCFYRINVLSFGTMYPM